LQAKDAYNNFTSAVKQQLYSSCPYYTLKTMAGNKTFLTVKLTTAKYKFATLFGLRLVQEEAV